MARKRHYNRPHLYIMRGLPGSGKSRTAREINESYESDGHCGQILSTDDYFKDEYGIMNFDRAMLGEAHDWNRERARTAMESGTHPLFIDNTNIRCWEMKSYVEMGLYFCYHIRFRCPKDHWKLSVKELWGRTSRRVPLGVMWSMKRRFEPCHDIYDVLDSER